MKRLVLLVALLLLGSGCASDPETQGATADCSSQVRVGDEVFTSYAFTRAQATRQGVADAAECHDVGADPAGSVFPDDPRQVRTWSFEGYSPDEVLGVRAGDDAFAVFIAESVSATERDRIADGLSNSGAGR